MGLCVNEVCTAVTGCWDGCVEVEVDGGYVGVGVWVHGFWINCIALC